MQSLSSHPFPLSPHETLYLTQFTCSLKKSSCQRDRRPFKISRNNEVLQRQTFPCLPRSAPVSGASCGTAFPKPEQVFPVLGCFLPLFPSPLPECRGSHQRADFPGADWQRVDSAALPRAMPDSNPQPRDQQVGIPPLLFVQGREREHGCVPPRTELHSAPWRIHPRKHLAETFPI